MWDWINCYLARRHEYVVWNNNNEVFLRCLRCGRRSHGWQIASNGSHEARHHRHLGLRGRHGLIAGALSLLGLLPIGR